MCRHFFSRGFTLSDFFTTPSVKLHASPVADYSEAAREGAHRRKNGLIMKGRRLEKLLSREPNDLYSSFKLQGALTDEVWEDLAWTWYVALRLSLYLNLTLSIWIRKFFASFVLQNQKLLKLWTVFACVPDGWWNDNQASRGIYRQLNRLPFLYY